MNDTKRVRPFIIRDGGRLVVSSGERAERDLCFWNDDRLKGSYPETGLWEVTGRLVYCSKARVAMDELSTLP